MLPLNFPPARHSIHGHGWQAPWSVAEATAGRAVLDYRHGADAWPFAYRSRQIVTLSADRLTMRPRNPFQAPVKRANNAIVISLVIPALAPVHVVLPDGHDARY